MELTHPLLLFSEVRHGADTQRHSGDGYEYHRQAGEDLPWQSRVGVLHHVPQSPHAPSCIVLLRSRELLALLTGLRGSKLGLLFVKPLLLLVLLLPEPQLPLAAPVQVVLLHPPVQQLLLEGQGTHLPQQPQLPRRQESDDSTESRRTSVKEILIAAAIIVVTHIHDLGLVAAAVQLSQPRHGKLLQCGPGDSVLDAPHVDDGRPIISVLLPGLRMKKELGSFVEQALLGGDLLWVLHPFEVEGGELMLSAAC